MCTARFFAARGFLARPTTTRRSGTTGIAQLRIWRDTFTATEPVSSSSSFTSQRKRFLARIDEPGKNWKFSLADVAERKFWKLYMRAYEECLTATSTRHSPWYVVPADDKENARLIVSRIILDAAEELKMTFPETSAKRRRELLVIRKSLTK